MPQSPNDPAASPLALSVQELAREPFVSARLAEAEERVGTTLGGKWRLEALLGRGGTAAVYAATHRNGMRGAVKLLDTVYSRDPGILHRFLREGYIANKVGHIGAVRVLDDDVTDDGCAYLVMELLAGEVLDERAANSGGHLGVQEVLWLTAQLLDVLGAAHDKGIVHRDLKPENLFLGADGVLKVLDFGLARIFEETGLPSSVTTSRCLMGTPAFMSPEQARGRWELVDGQSDLWSVGATMFTLLAGEFVNGNEGTAAEMIAAAFTRPARSLAEVVPDAPLAVVQLVDRALEREKGKRWLDARTMHEAVAQAHEAVFGGPLPARPAPSGRPSAPEGMFSFTSSRPRASTAPAPASREQPTLAPAAATPVGSLLPSLLPVTAAPQRRSRRVFFGLAAGAMLAVLGGGVAMLAAQSRVTAAARAALSGAPVESPIAPTSLTTSSTTEAPAATMTETAETPTGAAAAESAPAPGPSAAASHDRARPVAPTRTKIARPIPVPAHPAPAAATTTESTSLFDRRH